MSDGAAPQRLLVPGIDNSGPAHWQTVWEAEREGFRRADLGDWSRPDRERWVTRLDAEIRRAPGDVLLIAHSLGCLAVAGWAARRSAATAKVRGAMLVAPPVVEGETVFDDRLPAFAPCPRTVLPFPAIVVASRDDPYATLEQSRRMAADWRARLVDCGALGHINAGSDLGSWPQGAALLDDLERQCRPDHRSAPRPGPLPTQEKPSHDGTCGP